MTGRAGGGPRDGAGEAPRTGPARAARPPATEGEQPLPPAAPLVVGVGASRGVAVAEVLDLIAAALASAGRPAGALTALATVTAKAAEPGLVGAARRLGVPLRSFPAQVLAAVPVPAPSAAASAAVGTPSVAEAAALLAAGPGAELVAGKRKSAPYGRAARATCALAIGTGPDTSGLTDSTWGAATAPLRPADIVMTSPTTPRSGPPSAPPRPTARPRLQGDVVTTPPALLIAGHGTRDASGAEALRALVRALDERHPDVPVAGGFFGSSPVRPLDDAVEELVERGATRIAAVPLLLDPSGQAPDALPVSLARAAERHPGLDYACGAELGPHPKLLAVLERRLDEALGGGARRPEDRARTTVLLVGRGAPDPHANAEVARAARLLWEGRGFAGVETAFVSHAAPDVPAGLDRCSVLAAAAPGRGGPPRIVVLPYFLFRGDLLERLRMQSEGWAAAHPGIEVLGAGVIGPEPELADVVMERYREAVAGDPLLRDGHPDCAVAAEDGLGTACAPEQAGPAGERGGHVSAG